MYTLTSLPHWHFSGPMKQTIEINLTGLDSKWQEADLLAVCKGAGELNQVLSETNPAGDPSGT